MATVLGANAYWPASSSANGSNRIQKPEMAQLNGSVASSNSSASSLTAFNFEDSGVGAEDHTAAMNAFENGNSPHFYAPYQLQQLPHLNTIYQQPLYAPHLPFSNENAIGNNNTALFKDLDGSSKELFVAFALDSQKRLTR
jgi:hypothetical protein